MKLALATVLALAALGLGAAAAPGFPGDRCEYVEAGPAGPEGNRLLIVGGPVFLRLDGIGIEASGPGRRCTGTRPTVHNLDRIVVRDALGSEGVYLDQSLGRFGPGATPERFGSEIEISLEAARITIDGTVGSDAVRIKTLPGDHVAINLNQNADGPKPDNDVVLTGRLPGLVKYDGGLGSDRIDARQLTGVGRSDLEGTVRLFGDRGDDVILGSPGSDGLLSDGPGDDLVVAGLGDDLVNFGPGRDRIYGGPGRDALLFYGRIWRSGPPTDPPDLVSGGSGPDLIDDLNGRADTIRCGPGFDEVLRDPADRDGAGCERFRPRRG